MLGPFLFAFFVLALAVTGFCVWRLTGHAVDLGERLSQSERECGRLRVLLKQIEEADGEHEDDLAFRRATREIRLSRWRSSRLES